MSYENEKEVVLTNSTFKWWAESVNGNKASMKRDTWTEEKPLFHLNEATGTKTELERYEFCYHPLKLDATADEIIANTDEVIENPEPNKTATAFYFAKAGHVIKEHCQIG